MMHLTRRQPERFFLDQVTEHARRRRSGPKPTVAEARGWLPLLQASATVLDGSTLVSCHDPVAA